jgi:hypothetical protein
MEEVVEMEYLEAPELMPYFWDAAVGELTVALDLCRRQ